jgi:hypothetical protein
MSSPSGIRSWKCFNIAVSSLCTEIASASPAAVLNVTTKGAVGLRTLDHDLALCPSPPPPLPPILFRLRFTAGCAGFFILSQSGERPER